MSNFKITAPPWRFTANFTSQSVVGCGWEESGWIDDASATTLVGARGIALTWSEKRLALSLPDVSIGKIRVWDTNQVYRGGGLLVPLGTANVGTYVAGSGSPETLDPSIKLLMRLQNSAAGVGVSDFIGGIPNDQITSNGYYAPISPFSTAMTAYQTFIQTSLCMVRKALVAPHDVTSYEIDDIQILGIPRSRKLGRYFQIFKSMDLRS